METQATERSFIAFISYRHTPLDKQAAERIQKSIENYVVPAEFRERVGGKRLGMVFRDEDELPVSSSLTDSIYYALDHSKYLIVICTPDLPLSKWCEQEIRYFIRTHDRDHVIAVLVDGTPDESFSPYLLHVFDEEGNIIRSTEPLGANIAGPNHTIDNKAYKKEIVRVYAALIGCPFDALWQRQKRARTNRLLALLGVAFAIMAVFLGVVLNRNAMIEEQNAVITEQNQSLAAQLSTTRVDSGFTKVAEFDYKGALADALAAMESGNDETIDPRVGELLTDTLGSYWTKRIANRVVYEQPTDITALIVSPDDRSVLLFDQVGVVRLLDAATYEVRWQHNVGDESASLFFTKNGDVLCTTAGSVSCYAAADGTERWSYEKEAENYFRALSADGSILAVLDHEPYPPDVWAFEYTRQPVAIFLDTADGHELGRVELARDGYKLQLSDYEKAKSYGGAFSDDNHQFVFIAEYEAVEQEEIAEEPEAGEETAETAAEEEAAGEEAVGEEAPGEDEETAEDSEAAAEEEAAPETPPEDGMLVFTVDLKDFTKRDRGRLNDTGGGQQIIYGMYVNDRNGDLFYAKYSTGYGAIISAAQQIRGGEDIFHAQATNHTMGSASGINWVEAEEDANRTPEMIWLENGRAVVLSGRQMFIFDGQNAELKHIYEFNGRIVSAWRQAGNATAVELVTDDGYYAVYDLGSTTGVLKSVNGFSLGQSGVALMAPRQGGLSGEGSFLTVRQTAPGRLVEAARASDPSGETLDVLEDINAHGDSVNIEMLPGTGRYMIYAKEYDSQASQATVHVRVVDAATQEIVRSGEVVENGIYVEGASLLALDEERFLFQNQIYHLDGTMEYLERVTEDRKYETSSCQSVRLADGRVLTACDMAGEGKFDPVWIDGELLARSADLDDGLAVATSPVFAVGGNGYVLSYGLPYSAEQREHVQSFEAKTVPYTLLGEDEVMPYIDLDEEEEIGSGEPAPEGGAAEAGEEGGAAEAADEETDAGSGLLAEPPAEPCFALFNALAPGQAYVRDRHPEAELTSVVMGTEKPCAAAIYADGNVTFYDLENGTGKDLAEPYAVNEIQTACFATGDDYFVVLTNAGQIDVYACETMERVYRETLGLMRNEMEYIDFIKAYPVTGGEEEAPESFLFIKTGMHYNNVGQSAIIDSRHWVLHNTIDDVYFADSESGLLYAYRFQVGTDLQSIIRYPLHSREALKTQAEAELAG